MPTSPSMRRLLAVALLTWREGFRQGGLLLTLGILTGLVALLPWVTQFALGDEFELIRELIVDTAALVVIVPSVLVLATNAERERQSGTMMLWRTKPLRIGELLVGRALGVLWVVALGWLFFFLASSLVLYLAQFETRRSWVQLPLGPFIERELWPLWVALLLVSARAVIMVALLTVFSLRARAGAIAFFALVIFAVGHLNHTLLADWLASDETWRVVAGRLAMAVLPDFQISDVRDALAAGEVPALGLVPWCFAHAILYSAAVILWGARRHARRETA